MKRLIIAALLAPACLVAADATPQEAGREIGAILAWRLGPEAMEERCRDADPGGAGFRREAVNTWLKKNEALIKQVDARVAEVIPLLQKPAGDVDPVVRVRKQVREMFLDSVFEGKSADEAKAICQSESNSEHPRWNNNGLPHVQQSLAALDDWLVRRGVKATTP